MATLHRQIMDAEALLLAKVGYELRQCIPGRQIRECRVDSILFQAGRRAKAVMDKISSLTYGDLNAPPQDNCFQKFVRHEHELQSSAVAFRAYSIKSDDQLVLRGSYKQLKLEVAPPQPCVNWTYYSAEAFQERILNRESGYISGIAGTGKSYTMKKLREELEAHGCWCKVAAECHVAALNAGGGTADAFLHKYQNGGFAQKRCCLLYTSPSPRDRTRPRMPSSA